MADGDGQRERIEIRMRVKSFLKDHMAWLVLVALTLALMGGMRLTVWADSSGSIELQFPREASGAQITLYAVAEISEGSLHYYEPFGGTDFTISDLADAQKVEQAAEQFALLAVSNSVSGIAGTADESGALVFTGLAPALYLAVQTGGSERIEIQKALIPIPYTEETGALCYDAIITPKYSIPEGAVILHKTDETGTSVGQVRFVLQRKVYIGSSGAVPEGAETGQDVGGRFVWEDFRTDLITNDRGQLSLSNLPLGTYRFVEQQTPGGFILTTTPCYFAIDAAGQVREANGLFTPASGQVPEVTVVNQRTSVRINKVDSKGNPVAGAKLVIKDADGNVILDGDGNARYAFTTTEQPTELKQLPPGEYYVCEIEAPDGYRVAQDVKVTISDAPDAVNTVTMVDERETTTNAVLHVTKQLMDLDERAVAAEEDTFYVALFSDEDRSHRVSDVRALHYVGSSSQTVTFENLDLNTVYYVGETTEYGDLLIGGSQDDLYYTPLYPDGYTVQLTPQKPEASLRFRNVFFELPRDYYYEGSLEITKRTLRGSEAYDCDEVFYAGIFTDAQHTNRYGDVIALEMGGGSETSVTVPVFIGETIDSSITYYVTETDADGNPLEGAVGLEFEIEQDRTSVTLTPDQTEGSVTITNRYHETEEESEEEEGGSPGTSTGNPPTTTVRTGDDTPLLQYGLLLAAAGAAAIGGIAGKRRRRQSR